MINIIVNQLIDEQYDRRRQVLGKKANVTFSLFQFSNSLSFHKYLIFHCPKCEVFVYKKYKAVCGKKPARVQILRGICNI